MAKNNLQDLVEHIYGSSKHHHVGFGLGKVKSNIDRQAALRTIRWSLLLLGFGLGFLAVAFKDSWVTRSPLFIVAGSVMCFLFVVFCWLAGVLWWVVTGSKVVCTWAKNLWPFCVQPYRSVAGIVAVFIVIALLSPLLLMACGRLPWVGRNLTVFLLWLRRLLWLFTLGVWLASICVNLAGFMGITIFD